MGTTGTVSQLLGVFIVRPVSRTREGFHFGERASNDADRGESHGEEENWREGARSGNRKTEALKSWSAP